MSRSKTKAVIWDMDGVIVDSGPYHFKAWQHVFQKEGVDFTEPDFRRNFGRRNDAIIRTTLGENIQLILRGLVIEGLFQVIVSGREVSEGKPSPQGFLLAAERLNVEPGNCIVIEDAIAGVAAAKRAGMHCIAVTNTHPGESLAEADLIVDTLEEVTVGDLEEFLSREV